MPRTFKEYHLVDLLTGESLGGFTTLAGAREEARASGLTSWDIFRGNVHIERHDPGISDPVVPCADVAVKQQAESLPNAAPEKAGANLAVTNDPVALGLVVSFARPGGNATGINFPLAEVAVKELGLLHEVVPAARRIGLLVQPQ